MARVLNSKQSTYGGPYAFYTVDLTVSNRTETSVVVNYTITSRLQYSVSYLGYSLTAYLTVGGKSSGGIALKGNETWSGTGEHIKTGSFTVTGLSATTSALAVAFSVTSGSSDYAAGLNSTSCSNVAVDVYAKATTPTVSAATVACGGKVTINTSSRLLSTYKHTLKYSIGNASGTIATGVLTSYEWTVPASIANQIPSKTSDTVVITCETYNASGGLVGSANINLKVTVPDSYKVTISSIDVSEAVAKVKSAFGVYVQNLSQLLTKINVNTSNAYGATVVHYATEIDGIAYPGQAFTSNEIKTAGTVTIKTTIIDSRGRTHSLSKSITVVKYFRPEVSLKVAVSGSTATATIGWNVAPVSDKNSITLTFKYKKATDSNFGTPTTIATSEFSSNTTKSVTIDTSTTYEYVVEIADKMYSNTASDSAGTVVLSLLAGGKGVRLFAEAVHEGFWVGDVDYTITNDEYKALENLIASISVGGVRVIDWIFPPGHIIQTTNEKYDPNKLFKGTTWTKIKDKFLLSAGDTYTAGTTGGEASHKLTTSEMPVHSGHLYTSSPVGTGSATSRYLPRTALSSYGSTGRGWNDFNSGEMYPAGRDVGGSQPHNNMPPYLAVYTWQRIS